jgi:murein DD-endopeptidase MepM/ murein hydrolase activator NlpD
MGSNLYAIASGTVVKKGPAVNCIGFNCNNGFGNYVVVKHTVGGKNVYALYAHMKSESPKGVGDSVGKGDVVGYMGCTGYTIPYPCGIHVHFMLISDSFETNGAACVYGSSKCYNPQRFINPIG